MITLKQPSSSITLPLELEKESLGKLPATRIEVGNKQERLVQFSDLIGNKLSVLTLVAGLGLGSLNNESQGSIISGSDRDPAYKELGTEQSDTVWIEGSYMGFQFYGSGLLIKGDFADWIVTAGHVAALGNGSPLPASTFTIGDGTSYMSDRGNTATASEVILPFGFAFGDHSRPDIAFIRLSTRLSNSSQYFKFGLEPNYGDALILSGYGDPVSQSEGALPKDGFIRGFTSGNSDSAPAGFNSDFYNSAQRDTVDYSGELPANLANLGGVGYTRDSGGPVKDMFGGVVGIMTDANSSGTFYADINNPAVKGAINDIIRPTQAPEPSVGVFTMLGLGWLAARRNRQRLPNKQES